MNKQLLAISKLATEYIQSLNPYAEVIFLFPSEDGPNEDPQIYVLTPDQVDYSVEHQYQHARYQVEVNSGQSVSLHIYHKEEWHQQFIDTPLYTKVHTEGIHL